ncbi:polysaccharide deacetylase family protein [Rhizobacter sp. P5_C2]
MTPLQPSPSLPPSPALRVTTWPVPVFLLLSAGLHLLALLAVLRSPSDWPWALGAVVLNHLAITLLGLWPRSTWLGDNITRLPAEAAARGEIALTLDDGPDPVLTPQVLDLLDAAGVHATFFVIAERAAAQPALLHEIVRRGHSVQNHSWRHPHAFSVFGPRRIARELQQAQAFLHGATSERPTLFRAPAGLRNVFLDPLLHRMGLRLASWTRRGFDTRDGDTQRVLARLTRGLRGGDILLLHDGHCASTPEGRPVVLDVLPMLIAQAQQAGLRFVRLTDAWPAQTAVATVNASVTP